jgi:hypothetical protein
MSVNKFLIGSSALLMLAAITAPAAAAPTTREILGSELLVKEYLEKLDMPAGRIRPLADALLTRTFPDYLFFVAVYPQAAAADLPEPLKAVNVFAVAPDGHVKLLARSEDFVELFKVGFSPERGEERCKTAVRVSLLLLKARHPEYVFAWPVEEITLKSDSDRGKVAVGRVVAKEGGSGAIEVTLTLNRNCDPLKLVEVVTLKRGQVEVVAPTTTEIADAEKVVKGYLGDVKVTVESVKYLDDPILLKTFRGSLFFVAQVIDPSASDPESKKREVVIVGPEGKAYHLFGKEGQFGTWFNATFGPATEERRLKEGLGVAVRLLEASNSTLKFDPADEPRITNEDDGQRVITSRALATGAAGKKWVLTIRLRFGKRGKLIAWHWGLKREGA